MEINEKIDKYVLAQGNQVGSGAELAGILKEMVEEMPGPPGPQGPQGPQGNTGSSVDYPFELVNNLTTDDPEKGLSAAQGVVLKGEINQLGQEIKETYTPKSLGINLVNVNDPNFARGKYIDGNVLRTDSNYDTTGYISVDPETEYSSAFESDPLRFISYYDEGKNYLSNTQNKTTFTTPANCKYIRATFYSTAWGYLMISKGSRASYEPYNPISGYLPVSADKLCIKLMGFGNYGPSAGVTQDGECFYNTDTHQIWQATKFTSNRYRVIPFYPGAIYTYNGNFYIWNGEALVKAPSDLQTLSTNLASLASDVSNMETEIDNLPNTIDPILENPLKGVSFPVGTPAAIKEAIIKVWITSETPSNVTKVIQNAPKLYIYDIRNDIGSYRPLVAISPTKTNPDSAFSWSLNSQNSPRTVKEIIRANIRDPYYTNWGLDTARAFVCIEIDWSKVVGTHTALSIELNTEQLNRYEMENVSLSQVKGSILQNAFAGKNIVCFGDSITELADTNGLRYSDYLSEFSGGNVINVGIGGASIRQRLEPVSVPTSNSEAYAALDVVNMVEASVQQDFSKQIAAAEYLRDHASDDNTAIVARLQAIDWSKVDIVTVFAGTNDWYGGTQVGEHGTVSKWTTLGAINYIIRNILSTYKHIQLFWVLPIVRWLSYSSGSGTDANWGGTYKAGDYTLKEFAELIKTEVADYSLPICDLYNTLGWNKYNFSNYFPDNDGTHPRKPDGMRGIGARLFAFLLSNKNL